MAGRVMALRVRGQRFSEMHISAILIHLFLSCRASYMHGVAYLAAVFVVLPPYLDPSTLRQWAAFRGHHRALMCEREGYLSLPPSSQALGPCGFSTPFSLPPPTGFHPSPAYLFFFSPPLPLLFHLHRVSFCLHINTIFAFSFRFISTCSDAAAQRLIWHAHAPRRTISTKHVNKYKMSAPTQRLHVLVELLALLQVPRSHKNLGHVCRQVKMEGWVRQSRLQRQRLGRMREGGRQAETGQSAARAHWLNPHRLFVMSSDRRENLEGGGGATRGGAWLAASPIEQPTEFKCSFIFSF